MKTFINRQILIPVAQIDIGVLTGTRTSPLLAEVVGQERSSAAEKRDSAMLLADAACPDPAALHRHEQHDHAENIAEHGGGGVRLHVTSPRGQRMGHVTRRG